MSGNIIFTSKSFDKLIFTQNFANLRKMRFLGLISFKKLIFMKMMKFLKNDEFKAQNDKFDDSA